MSHLILRFLAVLMIAAAVAACSGPQPFGKLEGQAVGTQPVLPPNEAFKKAGPGAENDTDYETVYGPGITSPDGSSGEELPTEDQAAVEDQVAAAPTPEPPTPSKSGKKEIKAVAVVPVKGAPGKGNAELTAAMRATLRDAGWPVLEQPRADALTISGAVAIAAPQGQAQNVSLSWKVTAFDGTHLGTIKQANNVPPGSLDKSWGEAAGYAAEAGATGIYDLIKRYR